MPSPQADQEGIALDMVYPAEKPVFTRVPLHRAQRWAAEGEDPNSDVVKVFVTQRSYRLLWEHARSDMEREVGGWLVGRWCWDKDQFEEFVVVEAVLPASQVKHSSTYLTFTQESQLAMLSQLETRYPEKGIVGWYHTHPRMGLFLSGYDLWLHDNFFSQPWQVALVMDPHRASGGFFIRNRDHELDPGRYSGFYELRRGKAQSVVRWANLRLEESENSVEKEVKP